MIRTKYVRGVANLKTILIVFAVGLVVASGAVMYGRSDRGQIDVSAAISNANVTRSSSGESQVNMPAPRAFQNLPNGGLVGTGKPDDVPPPPPAPETASTTEGDGDAPSTESATEENAAPGETPAETVPAE